MNKLSRYLVSFFLFVVSLTGIFVVFVSHNEYFFGVYRSNEIEFVYPSYAAVDSIGNVYIIDYSRRRLTKVNSDGNVEWALMGGLRGEGNFFYANEVIVDSDDNLYLLSLVPDDAGLFTVKEEILRFSPDGNYLDTIFRKTYVRDADGRKKNTLVQRGQILSLEYRSGVVSWYDLTDEDVIQYNFDVGRERLSFQTELVYNSPNIFISGISRKDNGFVFVTKQGFIYDYCKLTAEITMVYSGDDNSDGYNFSVPWAVKVDSQGDMYFSDLGRRSIEKISNSTQSVMLNYEVLLKNELPAGENIYHSFNANFDGSISLCDAESVIIVSPEGEIYSYFSQAPFTKLRVVYRYILNLYVVFSMFVFIIFLRNFYVNILEKRVSIMLKQVIIFIPIIVVSITYVSNRLIKHFEERHMSEVVNNMSQLVQIIPSLVDADLIHDIEAQEDFMGESYRTLRTQFHSSLNYNMDDWNNSLYFAVYRVINNNLYGFMFLNDGISLITPFDYGFEDPESPYRLAHNGKISWETDSDISGDWIYAIGPIKDSSGKVVALLEVGSDLYSFNVQNKILIEQMIKYITAVVMILIVSIMGLTYLLLASIRNLRNGVQLISEGKWDYKIKVRNSNDEVEDLKNSFNMMTEYINNYLKEITDLNRGYRRFVPEQFLTFLGKESVVQVHLGDQIQKEMTVLFSDIRAFTEMSDKMSPKENFDFINSYLSFVGPLVRKNNGFIDKYIGDAVMALYPTSADDAVNTAIDVLNVLYEFNAVRAVSGAEEIRCGFGIHTGLLMLGIIGEEERVDSTVISDNVNLASRIEGLTKHFGATIMISETTYKHLKSPQKYSHRFLGSVTVKGKESSVGLYEIFDGLFGKERDLKIRTKEDFEEGVRLYQKGKLKEAKQYFGKTLKANPDDLISSMYYKICFTYINTGIPEKWDGTIKMTNK